MHRNPNDRPRAFICHDIRDTPTIAEPIAVNLERLLCYVWYDEFSVRIGDSLQECINRGLAECPKCILLLTPNLLATGGWSRDEYDAAFTPELVEDRKAIVPVWDQISREDVYECSPILANLEAPYWTRNIDKVLVHLYRAISPGI